MISNRMNRTKPHPSNLEERKFTKVSANNFIIGHDNMRDLQSFRIENEPKSEFLGRINNHDENEFVFLFFHPKGHSV